MKYSLSLILLLALCLLPLAAQTPKAPEEGLVTINAGTNLNEAVRILELSSQKFENKKMFNQSSYGGPIGVPVNRLPWRQAVELIALKNGLTVADQPGFIAFADN